ncbi:MAG TPA: serine/threonine-protein kinase [Candidatus Obscuribacterales bacterium]
MPSEESPADNAQEFASREDDEAVYDDFDAGELIGKVIDDKYEVVSLLGLGGMGAVYMARHKDINRVVALKVLLKHLVAEKRAKERFRQEAKAAGSLHHANLIAVHDFGFINDEQPFLVMDYLDGESLEDILESSGALSAVRFLNIFVQVCKGLSHAHGLGLIHRDLKPSNVMIVKGEENEDIVKVVDFGIAKVLPQGDEKGQKLTKTGHVFGSPLYMSPEQCLGKPLDARSDIYSLGCLMYECLAGKPPLSGETTMSTLLKHINDLPDPLGKKEGADEVPAEIEKFIFKCLDKDPNKRFASTQEMASELKQFKERFTAGGAARKSGEKGTGSSANVSKRHSDSPPSPASGKKAAIASQKEAASPAKARDNTVKLSADKEREKTVPVAVPKDDKTSSNEETQALPSVPPSVAEKTLAFVSDASAFVLSLNLRTALALTITGIWVYPLIPWLLGESGVKILDTRIWYDDTPLTLLRGSEFLPRLIIVSIWMLLGFLVAYILLAPKKSNQ